MIELIEKWRLYVAAWLGGMLTVYCWSFIVSSVADFYRQALKQLVYGKKTNKILDAIENLTHEVRLLSKALSEKEKEKKVEAPPKQYSNGEARNDQ